MDITPITLLAGSHDDTESTGQGCFMNVIAYLNGEPQITDQSPCVCVTIRPIAIFANDFMNDFERTRLLPYVMRAMGTATDNKTVLMDRLAHVVKFSEKMAALAAEPTTYSCTSAKHAEYAAAYAKHAEYAAAYATCGLLAVMSAAHAAEYGELREEIIEACINFLEAVCPPLTPFGNGALSGAQKLAELAT